MFAVLAAIMLVGCTKDPIPKEPETTYTLEFQDNLLQESRKLAEEYGFRYVTFDLIFSEYYQGQRVATNLAKDVSDNFLYTYKATSKTEYVTVRFDIKMSGHYSREDSKITMYIANVFYLEKGKDTKIWFSTNTLTSSTEP